MQKLLLFGVFTFNVLFAHSQIHDFLSLKKRNGRTVQNFYTGSKISFMSHGNFYEGLIDKIQHDSVYLRMFHVNVLQTNWGTAIYDTVSRFEMPFYYKDIRITYKDINGLKLSNAYVQYRFLYWIAKRAWIGAAGYIVLNVFNSAYLKDKLTSNRNLTSVGIALGTFATAFYLDRKLNPRKYSPRGYRLTYVKMN